LASLAGTTEVLVNSLHSQGIDRPGPTLCIEAVAPDGQIEAVSLPEARFVVGVQWHPEQGSDPRLFTALVGAAYERAAAERMTAERATTGGTVLAPMI
jgi:putative glutamine amidotransferase